MKTKTLSKSLFPLCALPFFSSFPVVAKQQGNNFSLVLPVVPEAGREKGTQWRHCGVNVPPPGCGCRAASCGPDDCAPWWSAGRDATCHVGMWVEHAALQLQSRASLKHKAEPTSSPGDTVLCVLCVCVFALHKHSNKSPENPFSGGSDRRWWTSSQKSSAWP